MRTFFLLPVVACLAGGPAVAEAPFAPQAAQPDYVVTMAWGSYGKTGRRVATHHGNWTRVDQFGTEYFSADGLSNIHVHGNGSVSFERGHPPQGYRDNEPRNTGERQTHLGESCTVWDVWRTELAPIPGSRFSHLNCVTDDGIELWQKDISAQFGVRGSAEATRVERRLVAPDQVQPARALLTLDWSDQNAPASGARALPDHETIMEGSDGSAKAEKSIRTTRRLGPWEFLEEKVDHFRRSLRITHDSRRIYLHYFHSDGHAHERLDFVRYEPTPTDAPAQTSVQTKSMQPRELDRSETVLGETCRWFNMTPSMADSSQFACLTSDGITLKEKLSGRFSGTQIWTAISLARRPIGIDEIKPPAELLDPQRWGLE